jgi:DeoR/GlpR family transcriptional regulator of sugar metabolism
MMRTADEVIVVADSTKFGRTSLARLCELGDIDTLVVDGGLAEEWLDRFSHAGVRVVVAGASTVPDQRTAEATT